MTGRDPIDPREWQEAVDAAAGALLLDSARKCGLVSGGPQVDVARCADILARGHDAGVRPSEAGVDAFIHALGGAEPALKDGARRGLGE